MKHDYSDVVPEGFYTPDGKVNFSSLVTREDHLYALSVAQRAIDNINQQIESTPDGGEEWRKKADSAHKAWTWTISRVRERLAIFKSREKSIKLSRAILIRKFLVQELKKHVPRSVYKECDRIARDMARQESNKGAPMGEDQ